MIYYNKLKNLLFLVKDYKESKIESKEDLISKINENDFFNYNIQTEGDDVFYRDLLKNDITLLKDYLYNTNTTIAIEVFLYQLKLFDDKKDTIPSYTQPVKDESDIKYNDISREILLLLLNMYLKNKKNLLFEKEIIDKFSKISSVPNEKIPISIINNDKLILLLLKYLQNKKNNFEEIKDIEKNIKEIKINLDKVKIKKEISKEFLLKVLDLYLKYLKINKKIIPQDTVMKHKGGSDTNPVECSKLDSFYCILKEAVDTLNKSGPESMSEFDIKPLIEKLQRKINKSEKSINKEPFKDLKIRSHLFNKSQYLKLFSILSLLFKNVDDIKNIQKKYSDVQNNIFVNTHRLFTKLDDDCYKLLEKTFIKKKILKNYRLVDVFGNVVKLLDFGKIIDRDTEYGKFCNTLKINPYKQTLSKDGKSQKIKDEKYILTYTLMNILHYEHEEIFKNIRGGKSGLVDVQVFAKIYDLCWNSYNHCCAMNLKLLDNYVVLEKIFNELKKTNKNVYTFLRIRHDKYKGVFPPYNHKFGFTYEPTYNSNPSSFLAFTSISMLSNSRKLESSSEISSIVNDSEFNITYYNRDFIIDAKLFGINELQKSEQIRLVNDANDLRNMQTLYNKNYSVERLEGKETLLSKKKTSKYERYIFGPFDSIYDHKISLGKIIKTDKKMINLKEKLESGESVCFVGNGQSGTGKTSFLLGYFTDKLNNGLVDFLIKNKMDDIVEVRIGEVYLNEKKESTTEIKIIKGDTLKNLANEDKNPGWVLFQLLGDELKMQKEGKYANLKIERKVRSTTNNRVSSRSHAVIDIVLEYKAKVPEAEAEADSKIKASKKIISHLIICDLAGVENTFQCSSRDVRYGFFKKLDEEYTKRKKKLEEKKIGDEYNFTNFLEQIYWVKCGFDLPNDGDYDKIKKWTDGIDGRNYNQYNEYKKVYNDFNTNNRELINYIKEIKYKVKLLKTSPKELKTLKQEEQIIFQNILHEKQEQYIINGTTEIKTMISWLNNPVTSFGRNLRKSLNAKIKKYEELLKKNKNTLKLLNKNSPEYNWYIELKKLENSDLFLNIIKACKFSSLEGRDVINKELREIVRDISKYELFNSKNSLYNGSELNSFCYDQDISSYKLELFYDDDIIDSGSTKYWSGKIFDLIYMNDVKIMEWNNGENKNFVEAKDYTNEYEIDKINFATVTVIDGRNYDFGGNFRNNEITGKLIPYFPTKKYILKDYNSRESKSEGKESEPEGEESEPEGKERKSVDKKSKPGSEGDQLKEDIIDGINNFDNIYLLRYYKNIFNPGKEDEMNEIYDNFINNQKNKNDTNLKEEIGKIKEKLKIELKDVRMNGIEMLRIIENTNALTLPGTLQTMTLTQSPVLGHTCSRYDKFYNDIPSQICYNKKIFGYGKKYIKYKKKYLKYKNIPYKNISLDTNTNYFNKYIKYKKKYHDLKYKYI